MLYNATETEEWMQIPTLPDNGSRFDPLAAESGFEPVTYQHKLNPSARCHYCESPAATRDHVVPVALGGCNSWWNLVPSCAPCNEAKDDQLSGCPCSFCTRSRDLYALNLHPPSVRRQSRRAQDKRRRSRNRNVKYQHLTYQIGDYLE